MRRLLFAAALVPCLAQAQTCRHGCPQIGVTVQCESGWLYDNLSTALLYRGKLVLRQQTITATWPPAISQTWEVDCSLEFHNCGNGPVGSDWDESRYWHWAEPRRAPGEDRP